MNKDNNYVVIMAGGIGSRLWPLSTKEKPKQFIDILQTGNTLLQLNYNKYSKFCKPENIYIVTNTNYAKLVSEQLPDIPKNNILCEPINKNTATCIAYAAYKIALINSEANIIITPSDHLLIDNEKFTDTITTALEFSATNNYIVTIGIKPYTADTEYGYIQYNTTEPVKDNIFKVKTFTEKPHKELAKKFLQSGDFLWNTGILTCKATSLINAFGKHLDTISHLFWDATSYLNTDKEVEKIKEIYSQCPNISIDYGIMEKADNICTIPAEFIWIDLGSWHSIYNNIPNKDRNNNALINSDNTKLSEVKNCLIYNLEKNKQIVVKSLSNFIIINTDHSLLIIENPKDKIKQE